jgi:cAMP phosphodiesterase
MRAWLTDNQGNSGGPREDNLTGLLVRAPQSEWHKGSLIAVDAGAHLASIIRILQQQMPRTSETLPEAGHKQLLEHGPFAGIRFPHISAKANALYVFRELLHSILITHPHLDHMSAIAMNTPALEYGREAKAIYGLPSTIDAIKNHIFNDMIWPNLSDEGHGVGFVTFRRLIEGGNPRLGQGEARGYINVCESLATKCWSVSHGKCHRRNHSISHQRGDSFGWGNNDYNFSRRMSRMSDHGYFAALDQHQHTVGGYNPGGQPPMPSTTPGLHPSQPPSAIDPNHMFEPVSSSAYFIRNDEDGRELLIWGDVEPDSVSMSPRNHIVWEDAANKLVLGCLKAIFIECSYDDSVRNEDLYGHLCPRHLIAELTFLAHAVMGIRKHRLAAVTGNGTDDVAHTDMSSFQVPTPTDLKRKRKRKYGLDNGDLSTTPELVPTEFSSPPSPQALHSAYVGSRSESKSRRTTSHSSIPVPIDAHRRIASEAVSEKPASRPSTPSRSRAVQFQAPGGASMNLPSGGLGTGSPNTHAQHLHPLTTNMEHGVSASEKPKEKLPEPLKGLTVHVIHVKDTLMDGPSPGDIILGQLRNLGSEAGLGVEFDVCTWGQSIWV